MFQALAYARKNGQLRIPTLTPNALRLRFYSLKKALDKAGRQAEMEGIIIRMNEDSIILANADMTPEADDIRAALAAVGEKPQVSISDEADAMLHRLGF